MGLLWKLPLPGYAEPLCRPVRRELRAQPGRSEAGPIHLSVVHCNTVF